MRRGAWLWGVVSMLGTPVTATAAEPDSAPVSALVSAPVPAPAPVPVSAPVPVLLTEVQGTEGVRHAYAERLGRALGDALQSRGYAVVADRARGDELVECGALECIEQALRSAGAEFAVVPAMWVRAGERRELTLTLVGKSDRNLNTGTVINGDLQRTAADLLDELLVRRVEVRGGGEDALATDEVAVEGAVTLPSTDAPRPEPKHPHAWKAGPVVLLAGGVGIFVGIGVAAGTKNEGQQLNKGAAAAWSVVGAAALAGGTAWWVVGDKRRRLQSKPTEAATATTIRVSPGGIDFRLRF